MKRPELRSIPLSEAVPLKRGIVTMSMSEGQWDVLLQAAYDQGFVLLELDAQEQPVRAFQKYDADVH